MDIRLIALDLDETLLDSQKRLSPGNRRALEKCMEQGIEIVPCTGRIWAGIPEFIREMPGIHYAITTNGAVIEDLVNHQVLDERKLSWQQAVEILEMGKNLHIMYDVYEGGQGYGEARFMECMADYGIPPLVQEMIRTTRLVVPDIIEKVKEIRLPAEKVNYFFGDSEKRAYAREALNARGDVFVSSSFPYNLEINALGATKGEALLRLGKYLGLKREQLMGFGDGENDLTMIRMAGVGVAMANAVESLREAADYVTKTNDEDGVAAAVERLIWNL